MLWRDKLLFSSLTWICRLRCLSKRIWNRLVHGRPPISSPAFVVVQALLVAHLTAALPAAVPSGRLVAPVELHTNNTLVQGGPVQKGHGVQRALMVKVPEQKEGRKEMGCRLERGM